MRDELSKANRSIVVRILPWIALLLIIGSVAYYFTHANETSCYVNPYSGDNGCSDMNE